MQAGDLSNVYQRLVAMLRLLIQHGGTQGGFPAAVQAASCGLNAALVILHGNQCRQAASSHA
jgi:hypothetical protein